MLIHGNNLKLYHSNGNGAFENLKEIDKKEYGYDLQPGQKIYNIKYDKSPFQYFGLTIAKVDKTSIVLTDGTEIAWSMADMILEIEPCETLYEKNKLKDILSGNIAHETFHPMIDFGKGIWYKHGGWRKHSGYESNLQNFVKIGQTTII